jgi:hypothetical protein
LTEKCFRWLESVFRWPESVFRWPTFLMANKHRKVWKVVFRKVNSRKQTWPKLIHQAKPSLIIIVMIIRCQRIPRKKHRWI